jgi:hypothetical protein
MVILVRSTGDAGSALALDRPIDAGVQVAT